MRNTARANASGCDFSGGGDGNLTTLFCTHRHRAPQRMFLCDVPIFLKRLSENDDNNSINTVRLMGTVVEILQTSLLPSSGTHLAQSTPQTQSIANNYLAHPTNLIHFVIEDGTGSISVFTERRVKRMGDYNGGESQGKSLSATNQTRNVPPTASKPLKQNQYLPSADQLSLELILTSPPPLIVQGQTVDCIGKIQLNTDEKLGVNIKNHNGKEQLSRRTWLAATSVSVVKNPQAVVLRHLELSSTKRRQRIGDDKNGQDRCVSNNDNPQNRILVAGSLQRKLNSLFHCDHQGTVALNIEDAFNYIKYSKDDGGITTQELALLVGAVEPNEMFAVNLAVEQLREDCRIYLNQGKWFPM